MRLTELKKIGELQTGITVQVSQTIFVSDAAGIRFVCSCTGIVASIRVIIADQIEETVQVDKYT